MLKYFYSCLTLFSVLNVVAQDIGVVSSSSPTNGCMLSSTELVEIFVFNFGSDVSTPFDVSYSINGGAPVTETVNLGTFVSLNSYTHTFSIPADLSVNGTYNICYYTTLAGDVNTSNDTICLSITSDAFSQGGSTQSSTTVCSGNNSGTINLVSSVGDVLNWESSMDFGATWSNIANTSPSENYLNLTSETWYKVIVKNGLCPNDTSTVSIISLDQPTIGGTLSGPDTVCANVNSGSVLLSGEFGGITSWEYSIDGGSSWSTIANTTNTNTFNNLAVSTLYRAVVQNGTCSLEYSDTLSIVAIPGAVGGTITSNVNSVCIGQNSEVLELTGYTGTIDSWEYSIDGGTLWNTISNTSNQETVNNISTETWYRVIVLGCDVDTSAIFIMQIDQLSNSGVLSGDTTVCLNNNYGEINLSGENGQVVDWLTSVDSGISWTSLGETTNMYSYTNVGTPSSFVALVKNGECPIDTTDLVLVDVFANNFSVMDDTEINEGDVIVLSASGGVNYSWTPANEVDDPSSSNPESSPSQTTTFYVDITDTNNCVYSDSVLITVLSSGIEVSNLITANGDGHNDEWIIKGAEAFANIKVSVLNKNGSLVYYSENYLNDWAGYYKGKYLPSGTYYYIIEHEGFETITGHLNILSNE